MTMMDELVSKVKVSKSKSDKAKSYAAASEWPKCRHNDCPLPTTIKAETVTCGYHYRQHDRSAECITEAIKENLPYLKKYNAMIFWNVKRWNEKRPQIMGWEVLPATEIEMNLPSLYLTRFKIWIDKRIVERAEEIYQGH